MDDGDGQWAASTCEEALAFVVPGLKPGRSGSAAHPRRGSSVTALILGGSAIAILMFLCLMMGSLFVEGATGVFIFLIWDALVLAYLLSYILRTQLCPVTGEGSKSSVRMMATRRGIEVDAASMVMPWPRSRSSLYPVVRRALGGTAVNAYLVLEASQVWLLPYIGRFRTGESTGRMLEIVNARLDELWAWGVEHGCTAESGQYVPARRPRQEQARRQAVTRLAASSSPQLSGVGMGEPGLAGATGPLRGEQETTSAWKRALVFAPAPGMARSKGEIRMESWRRRNVDVMWSFVLSGVAFALGAWMTHVNGSSSMFQWPGFTQAISLAILLCLALVLLARLALTERHDDYSFTFVRRERTVATGQGLSCLPFKWTRWTRPWPGSRTGFYTRVSGFGRKRAVCAYTATEDGESWRLPGMIHVGGRTQVPAMRAALDAQLDDLWSWGVEHGSSSAPRSALLHEVKGGAAGLG